MILYDSKNNKLYNWEPADDPKNKKSPTSNYNVAVFKLLGIWSLIIVGIISIFVFPPLAILAGAFAIGMWMDKVAGW